MNDSYSYDERRIGHLFKSLLRDWVMNPPDLYFRQVTDEIICRPDFNEVHDELEKILQETDYQSAYPSVEQVKAEMVQERASKYDNPLPPDFAGFSYHIPEEKWKQRAIPFLFRKRISLVLESNCPDYGYFFCAFKSLLMYAFVPQQKKNRSITPHFRDKIEQIFNLCEGKNRKIGDFIETLDIVRLGDMNLNGFFSGMMEDFEERLSSVYQILEILRVLRIFGNIS